MSDKDKKSDTTPQSGSSSIDDGSSSSSSSHDNDKGSNTIDDLELFVLAGRMAKLLADGTKTNSDRRKVLSQLATFYQMKVVPLNTVSQGSNQILNHLSNQKVQERKVDPAKFTPKTSRGQPPPNPVKKDPEYLKMSSEHQTLQRTLATLNKGTEEHTNILSKVRDLEHRMTKFKQERGRKAVDPSANFVGSSSAATSSNQ